MNLKDFVFVLGNYKCNKSCPYCIAKMNANTLESFEVELSRLESDICGYKEKGIIFEHFILSGNGEPSLYSEDELKRIKDLVETSGLFRDFRIQTSGNLFFEKNKLNLFSNWIKEITVISFDSKKDKDFYKYSKSYLDSKSFLDTNRIRVNIVLLKENIDDLKNMIESYTNMSNVETIALKILDDSNNDTKESNWIKEHSIRHSEIDKIINIVKQVCSFDTFYKRRFIFTTSNKKMLTIHFAEKNVYDQINLKQHFSWHNRPIKKGVYGEFSKVEEEVDEAREALEQNNSLMYLIELSDVIGAIEKVAENHGLSLQDLINFSRKVKESKKYE